jgi:type I restriction enzyme S subunit
LGELTDNLDARRIPVKEADRIPGPYPYYGASGIIDWVDRYIFDGEFLLVAEDGENLRTRKTPIGFMATGRFWVNNHAHIVRGNQRADTRFLMYALRATDVSGYLSGSTQPKLTRQSLDRIRVPAPPVHEQRAVADLLGALDDRIELNRRMNETLEAIAQAIFESWFTSADGEVKPLHDLIEINPIRRLSQSELAPHVEMADMPTRTARVFRWTTRPFSSGSRFANGDVLLARITPSLENGKTAFVDFLPEGGVGWGSTEYIVLRARPPLPPEYAYFVARSNAFREYAIASMTGTSGRQRVQVAALPDFPLVAPSETFARRFEGIVRPIFAAMRAHDEESRTLAALRDTMLPKLLSGELRLPGDQQN